MIIRDATINDYTDIYYLNKDGLGYDYPQDKTKEKLQTVLNLPSDKIFVMEINEKVVGYIHLSNYECIYSDSLKNILALVVDEEYRKNGIGQKLIQKAEEWAKAEGSKGIRLVSGHNRVTAHQFYLNCGYSMRKEQKNFIKWF
jgi:predicted N-acetyltransferase YhbS